MGLTVKIGPAGVAVTVGWGVTVGSLPVISNVAAAACSLAAPIVATTLEMSPTRPLMVISWVHFPLASVVPFVLPGSRSSVIGALGSAPLIIMVAVVPEGPLLGLMVRVGPSPLAISLTVCPANGAVQTHARLARARNARPR